MFTPKHSAMSSCKAAPKWLTPFDELERPHRPKRDLHSVCASLVIGEELRTWINDARVIAARLHEKGVSVSARQIQSFLEGRYRPQRKVVNAIAAAAELPDLRTASEWPWELLSDAALTLRDIERICAPSYEAHFRLPNDMASSINRRGRSRWHRPADFDPRHFYLERPGPPENFWFELACLRAAEALRDYPSINMHLWSVVGKIASLVTRRSVKPHAEFVYACIQRIAMHTPLHFVWFSIDWSIVRRGVAMDALERKMPSVPFKNVFQGQWSNLGELLNAHELERSLHTTDKCYAADTLALREAYAEDFNRVMSRSAQLDKNFDHSVEI